MQPGTILEITGAVIIAGGLLIGTLVGLYGNKLNQARSELSIHNDIKELKEQIGFLQRTKGAELKAEYPAGYELFGVIDRKIVPSGNPSSSEAKILWSTAKILNITKDFITIRLPDAILPGHNSLKNIQITLQNREGATASNSVVINNWHSYVKILKTDGNNVVAVLGYAKK